jgi:hypothetical protein
MDYETVTQACNKTFSSLGNENSPPASRMLGTGYHHNASHKPIYRSISRSQKIIFTMRMHILLITPALFDSNNLSEIRGNRLSLE